MKLLSFFQQLFSSRKTSTGNPSPQAAEPAHPYLLPGKVSWSVWPKGFASARDLLDQEVAYARHHRLRVIVYSHAAWCPGSAIFKQLRDHPEVAAAFSRVHLVEVGDQDLHQLSTLEMRSPSIPTFFAVDAQGNYSGQSITGAVWGPDVPETIGPAMTKWVASLG
ncbi:MAG: hypothetical protein AAGN35_14460 [Bacteroidota bacterium]